MIIASWIFLAIGLIALALTIAAAVATNNDHGGEDGKIGEVMGIAFFGAITLVAFAMCILLRVFSR